MNRSTRLALTAGLTLTAALTVGAAASAAPDLPPDGGSRYVAVQDPAPGGPDDRDCPWRDGAGPNDGPNAGPNAAPSAPAPTPAASTA